MTAQSLENDGRSVHPDRFGQERTEIRFGACVVVPGARALFRAGKPVEIGSRAFDLLMVLLGSRGELVTKEAIIRYVWPTTVVEESNLRFQMASLRRVLAADRAFIKTVPGRGYVLIVEEADPSCSPAPPAASRVVHAGGGERSAIFIVEQDRDLREVLLRLLRPFGARVMSLNALESARADRLQSII